MSKPILKIASFLRGMATAFGRGKEPEGSFADSRNLLPTKKGSLEQAYGYSTTGGLASLPTAFINPGEGNTGTDDMASVEAPVFAYSSESPSAYDGRVYFFRDDNSVNRVALDTVFVPANAPTQYSLYNSGFIVLDERKVIDADSADVTVTGASTNDIVIANAGANHQIRTDTDYYKGWRVEFNDSGTIEYAYVTGSTNAGGTVTITVKEDIGSSAMNWVTRGAGDTFTIRRWFHHPANMVPDFDHNSQPGECFESEGRVRGCGGASSDEDYFPWIAQYINRTWFANSSDPETYTGTYIDQMECKWDVRGSGVDIVTSPSFQTSGTGAVFDSGATKSFHIGYTIEYDGYIESPMADFTSVGIPAAANDTLDFDLNIPFARLNKRITAINIYLKEIASGVMSQAYWVKRIDLLAGSDAAWTWTNIGGTTYEFVLNGSVRTNDAHVTGDEWANRGETYYQRTGRLEELVDNGSGVMISDDTRHIVAWQEVEQIAGRALFGNYYDPNVGDTLVDQIRFTPISSFGVPNYDIIPAERDVYEKDVATGDPGIVRRLVEQNGRLIVFKDNSIFSFFITPTPETWSPQTISLRDGLVSRLGVVKMPNGDIGFPDTDFYKIIRNGTVFPVTWNIEATYFALTKASIVAWWDKIDSSLRITDQQVVSSEYPVYCFYPHLQYSDEARLVFPVFKIRIPHNVQYVTTERDGGVIFTNEGITAVYEWHSTDLSYAGTNIIPYFKTHAHVLDEDVLMSIDKVMLVRENTQTNGNMQGKLYVDSATSTTTFQAVSSTNLTKTNHFLKVRPTEKRMGRAVAFEYNVNASPEYNTAATIKLHAINYWGRLVKPTGVSR